MSFHSLNVARHPDECQDLLPIARGGDTVRSSNDPDFRQEGGWSWRASQR